MKTRYISIIFTLLLSLAIITTSLPAVQGISGSAYFMKSNSTAKIYADFTTHVLNNQSWDLKPEIVTSLDDFNTKPAGMTIDAYPKSFTGNQHHVHVTYTIIAKDNTKGVYPLFLFFCGTSPLVVGLNESEVNTAIYNKFFTAAYTCPAISGGIPDMNIIGYSGLLSKTLSIDSNNTITVTSVSKLGEPPQSPLKQFKSGIAANDVKCGQGLQLVIKAKDGSPACARPQTAQKLVERKWGWAMQSIDSIKPLPNRIIGLENDTGIVSLKNQTYYFETPNYTDTVYSNPVQISFHDVIFTLFPPGFRGGLPTDFGGVATNGCGGSYFWTDAKFSNGIHELLHLFAITTMSQHCQVLPAPTDFSTHTNPQAGLTFYDGKMKLLVNADHQVSSSTNYTESKVTDDTYLSQTVDEWKSKTPEQLKAYYEKYTDAFYDELGSFLIKDEMKKELARQKIQNIHDDFKVFPGMSLATLPPHISYDAVINATDGNNYLLLGGVFANKIESSPKIIKLVFDKNALHSLSTGNGPSYPDPSTNAHVDNSTSQEKVQIAGTYIEDSDIPWSSVGTGNYGVIQIGLYASVYHMIPDAQKYYTARAMQLIPFYVPVKILPPPSTEK